MSIKAVILTVLMFYSVHADADSHDVYGTYLIEEKTSHVQINDCGNGTPCGVIVWLNPETLESGITPETATSKAGKPVLGLTMLQGFTRKQNDWRGGTIYHPGKDKTYASKIKRLANGNLEVKGCISFFCQTQIWTEVIEQSD